MRQQLRLVDPQPLLQKHRQVSATASSAAGPPAPARAAPARRVPAGPHCRRPRSRGWPSRSELPAAAAPTLGAERGVPPSPRLGAATGKCRHLSHLEEFFTYLKATV